MALKFLGSFRSDSIFYIIVFIFKSRNKLTTEQFFFFFSFTQINPIIKNINLSQISVKLVKKKKMTSKFFLVLKKHKIF